jgi:DNA-binding IclR family transcriptional regulator
MPTTSSPFNSIQKVCGILRALGANAPMRLTDISTAAALNKVTTLRILDSLVLEGFVERVDGGKRYAFGPEFLAMTASHRRPENIRDIARPSLVRLASLSEDTVLLSVRSSNESVCIDYEVGSFPIRANYLKVGSRRPLGVGAGSLALLAWLQDQEIDAILEVLTPSLVAYPKLPPEVIRAEIAASRQRGYTLVLDKIVDRMGAVGIPLFNPDGTTASAISIAALSERIEKRLPELVAALRREAELIARECRSAGSRTPSPAPRRRNAR